MANKWLTQLTKYEDTVRGDYDPWAHVVSSGSPSFNFTFGKTHGLPFGYTLCLYGFQKGGKTLLANNIIGQLHKDDPDAIAIKFDTELREMAQMTEQQRALYGIDPERYVCYSTNRPVEVFDRIEKDISALCDQGAPVKLIVIDSIAGILGRREENSDTIETQQIGDMALTIQTGLKRILPTIRRKKIALILTNHVRAEMDKLEQMRGNSVKMAGSFGLKHMAEFFMWVETNRSKDGKEDLSGNELRNADLKDVTLGKGEITGQKIKVCMKESSCGVKGRWGEFTWDYNKGLVNVHEEVFLLGVARGIVQRPNIRSYIFGGNKWSSKEDFLNALRDNPDLQKEIIKELKRRDLEGVVPVAPEDIVAE